MEDLADHDLDKVDAARVMPTINGDVLRNGELVGDVLSVISLKHLSDDADPDRVVKRNSFRDLHYPNISHLQWVAQSDSKEEVCRFIWQCFSTFIYE